MTTNQNNTTVTDDLTLYGLFALFLRNWLILTVSGFSFAILALVWSLGQPNIYTAKTLLMPAGDDSGGLGGLAGSLGGLAAVAGVSLPEGKTDNTKLALELIETQVFLGEFIEENDLVLPIMAAEGWDEASNKLIIDPEKYDEATSTWVRKPKAPRKVIPSTQETYEELKKLISVEQDPKSKFVTISVDFYSPYLAAKWVDGLVEKLNESIRLRDKQEATESITYLEKLSQDSNVQGLRSTFSSLMEEQIKSRMLAEVRKDYVFKIVDPAVVPELKSKPKRSIIVVVAGFIGGIIGIIIVLFRSGRKAYLASN
ncbi:LPS O-antigen length regulator [Thalassotalea euphylliae]|uniref:LPS O-antigen length regulator n=1 Tax=Thalassotalea euphylliae TaxID=1655234 RepID=A0A3E0TNW0_9GAMM|nr:GNVR domain-containing protein [Thalassotalea euphylliae]REL26123.1 LPS O-antigen length regulator [Thalassotalea euphylliae]